MLDALPYFISPVAFLIMGVRGIPLAQYYIGQRRDLYFLPKERLWLFWQTAFGLMVGSLALVCQLARIETTTASACCPGLLIYLLGMATLWIFLPALAFRWQPPWVVRFEKELSPDDLHLFITNGTRMLQRYPGTFRRVINHAAGWEQWMMTVVRPVRARESTRQRAK